MLFGNKKKWITDTCKNMDENQNHSEWKKPDTQRVCTECVHLYKLLESAN